MNGYNTRQAAIAKLQQLSDPSLDKVNQLLDALLIEQQSQALDTPSEQTLKEKWEKWFSEVDQLEVCPSSLNYHPSVAKQIPSTRLRVMILCDAGVLLCLVDPTQPLHSACSDVVLFFSSLLK